MPPLTPHVLQAIREAHTHATRTADDARADVLRLAEQLDQARRVLHDANQRQEELARALQDHQDATAEEEATRCPSCGMTAGQHTGGCRAQAQDVTEHHAPGCPGPHPLGTLCHGIRREA